MDPRTLVPALDAPGTHRARALNVSIH